MPKPASDIWNQYQVIGGSGSKKHVVCLHCNAEYKHSHATRMVLHITKCKKCPSDIKIKFMKSRKTTSVNIGPSQSDTLFSRQSTSFCSESDSTNVVLCNDSSVDQEQSSKLREQTINKDEIDTNIARAVYASGAPLSLLDSKYWKKALKALNPDYEPPTRHCISKLLNAEYSKVKSNLDNKIRLSTAVVIITDGWTNINGKGVINFNITLQAPMFFESECEKATAEYLSSEIIKVIEDIGPAKIVALITENAKNMKAAWQLVQNKYPDIACIGCVAHALNLIYNDIGKLPTLKSAVGTVTKIIKYVKNKHRAFAYFEKIQTMLYGNLKQSLKLPCETTWNTVILSLESFDNNKEALKELATAEDINVGDDIIHSLLDDEMWATIKNIIIFLKPISEAITESESDKARISEVPLTFIKLAASIEDRIHVSVFQDHEKEVIRQTISKIKDFCIQPLHLAANLLDPRYMGSVLTSDQEADANNLIHDMAQFLGKDPVAIMSNVAEYCTKTDFFARCHSAWITTETVAPQLWWQSFASKQVLFPIAYRLLSIPPSISAAKRNWSLFANTHSKPRNRLKKERINKLITVRQSLKYFDDENETSEDHLVSEYKPKVDFEFIGFDGAQSEDEHSEDEGDSEIEEELSSQDDGI